MASERTEAGGICWRVPNPNEAGPYYCETCGPVVLREGRGKRGRRRTKLRRRTCRVRRNPWETRVAVTRRMVTTKREDGHD